MIALSKQQHDAFEYYRPHYGIHSYTDPGEFNGASSLPEVDVGVLANWLEEEDYAIRDAAS